MCKLIKYFWNYWFTTFLLFCRTKCTTIKEEVCLQNSQAVCHTKFKEKCDTISKKECYTEDMNITNNEQTCTDKYAAECPEKWAKMQSATVWIPGTKNCVDLVIS